MNILLVAAEYAPYLTERTPAESVANLAKSLRLLDHTVTVVVPRHASYENGGLVPARRISPLTSGEAVEPRDLAHVFDVTLPSGVRLSLIELNQSALAIKSGENGAGSHASAEAQRAEWLGLWSQAVAAYVTAQASQGAPFDVVHAHDCEVGLALLSVRGVGLAKVLTVHDAGYAGTFPLDLAATLGLSDEWLGSHGFGLREEISLLKGLLTQVGAVIVPSESYGKKLQAPEHHGAMARAFQVVQLQGILEGVDQAVFNPATDASLACRYDAACPENKGRNRALVLKRLGLEFDPERPIVFCECDELGDSAWPTLVGALPALMRNQVTMILAGGEGVDQETREAFEDRLRIIPAPDAVARRQILAASDFYLSVRRKDPNGRALMQASRYGAVPIAFLADAIPDLIVDCDLELAAGNGLLYDSMSQRALQTIVARAVRCYRSPSWPRLLGRVMRRDLAWDRAARRHVQVYSQLLSSR